MTHQGTLALHRLDSRPVPKGSGEIRLFMCERNAAARLPHLLTHYRTIGVDRFFIVDNGSSDDSIEILLEQPDVHLFYTEESYAAATCGHLWLLGLIDDYGQDHWCVAADSDEFLIYPYYETMPLRMLCRDLTREGASTMHCILLDMFSNAPISSTRHDEAIFPLELCRYFETESIITLSPTRHYGGVRQRAFQVQPALDKFNLFKPKPTMHLKQGFHAQRGGKASVIHGAVLHFKFFSDFHEQAQQESIRKEHWNNGSEYAAYHGVLQRDPSLNLWTPSAVPFVNSTQLLELGVLNTSNGRPDRIERIEKQKISNA